MDERIERDLVAAHADSLRHGEAGDFPQRYRELFPRELAEVASLLALAEQLHRLFGEALTMREPFRQELKAGLLAQAHQQRIGGAARPWRWAALGASAVTVAGVLAAAAWRGHLNRP